MIDSYGFRPNGYDQIIVFKNEELFKEIVAANPRMTAIMGADDHTKKEFPGVFIAGLVEYLPADDKELRHERIPESRPKGGGDDPAGYGKQAGST